MRKIGFWGIVIVKFFMGMNAFGERYYVRTDGDDLNTGMSWETAFATMTKTADVVTSGDEVWVAGGTFKEGKQISIPVGVSYHGGFAGTETELNQRDSTTSPTIIDGNKAYRCVSNNDLSLIEGFHVTNGYYTKSGGGIFNSGTIVNCVVYNNKSEIDGGGIYNLGLVKNCTIYGNSALSTGGVYNRGTVINSIMWKNNADLYNYSGKEDVRFCCYGNALWGEGNISGDPKFVNTSGDPATWDFHLQNSSPCIDAGYLNAAPVMDIEGNPRPGSDGFVCMGAYESPDYYTSGHVASSRKLYVKLSGSDESKGDSWDSAFRTINKALERSYEDDSLYEIWVAYGTYNELETIFIPGFVELYGGFSGWEATLDDRDLESSPTLIDGRYLFRCVTNTGIIDKFDITRGHESIYAGGIYNDYGIVRNCKVYHHEFSGIYNRGGVVSKCHVYNNNPGIYNNYGTIIDCKVWGNEGMLGGGIHNEQGEVINCVVYDNECGNDGGGIYNKQGIVTNCKLFGNEGSNSGGGIYNDEGTIKNCLVYSNQSSGGAGGIFNLGTVLFCTIYNNRTGSIGSAGVFHNKGSITNSIIVKNQNGDVINYMLDNSISYCCIGGAIMGNGNFNANPLFMNTSGDISTWDFHLKNGSPCIDAGTTITAEEVRYDFEGNPRPGTDGKVCIGAYESPDSYLPESPEPVKRLYVKPDGDDLNSGLNWDAALKTIKYSLSKALQDDSLYEIWVAKGIYREGEALAVQGSMSLYGGFDGTEGQVDQRDIFHNPTVIDAMKISRVIENYGTLDGFCVTGGYIDKPSGGGILNGDGKVINCMVYGNYAKQNGGGIYNVYGILTRCAIFDNQTEGSGGGISNLDTITSCIVYNNYAKYNGGGIMNHYKISGCIIYGNTSERDGGGVNNDYGMIDRSIIHSNAVMAIGHVGGGIYNNEGIVTQCLIYNNKAEAGGGIRNRGTVNQCTVCNNSPDGIAINWGPVSNTIIWNNSDSDISYSYGVIKYCCYGEATGENGNISENPYFVKTSGNLYTWDFHLIEGSPCIDAGDPEPAMNDACLPPGMGTVRNDMGVYGGLLNCDSIPVYIPTREEYGDYLLGISKYKPPDLNNDNIIDMADVIAYLLSM